MQDFRSQGETMISNMRLRVLTLLLVLAYAFAAVVHTAAQSGQVAPAAKANWPQFKNTPNRTGVNPAETTIGKNNATSLQLSWQGLMGDLVDDSSPAVVNGVVY